MQSSRLRSGAASPVSTCMSTPSVSPTMPRGSRTPRSASSEKPIGSEWTTSRSAFSACLAPAAEHALDVGLVDLVAAEIDGRRIGLALQPAGGDVDDQRIDGQPRHALGRVDRQPDRLLGAVEIDDDARLHAVRLLVADADHLDLVGAAAQESGWARAGLSWATTQQILLDPTSSTVTMPARRCGTSRCPPSQLISCVSSFLLRLRLLLERRLAAQRRLRRQLDDEPVGEPQVDGRRCRATAAILRRRAPAARRWRRPRSCFGQLDGDAVSRRRSQRRSPTRT